MREGLRAEATWGYIRRRPGGKPEILVRKSWIRQDLDSNSQYFWGRVNPFGAEFDPQWLLQVALPETKNKEVKVGRPAR